MREIKFRAWNKRLKEMEQVINLDWFCEEDGTREKYDITTSKALVSDELILMQFIGFKDKNSKEIYEGDIVLFPYVGHIKPFKVVFGGAYNYAAFGITRKSEIVGSGPSWDTLNHLYTEKIEVIGNIYENPELIKEIE